MIGQSFKHDAIEWSNPRLLCIAGGLTKCMTSILYNKLNRILSFININIIVMGIYCILVNATTVQTIHTSEIDDSKSSTTNRNIRIKTVLII